MNERTETTRSQPMPDTKYRTLFVLGAVAAVTIVAFAVIQIIVFAISPPPATVQDWFRLFQENWLIGLLDFDLLYILDQVLMIFVYLAFFFAIRNANESMATVAIVLGLISIAVYVPSNSAFSMLSLSKKYASATLETDKSMLLASGQTMILLFSGTSYIVFTVLGSIAPILICAIILKHGIFSRATAWMGIIGNVLPVGLFLPSVGPYFGLLSVPFIVGWLLLSARRFIQLSRRKINIS